MESYLGLTKRFHFALAMMATASAGMAQAQDTIITAENSEIFTKSYVEVNMIDRAFATCQELAPDYAAANQAIMGNFSAAHSIDQARPVLEAAVNTQPDLEQALDGPLEKITGPLKTALNENSDLCRDDFSTLLARVEPQTIPAFLKEFGIDVVTDQAPAAAMAESDANVATQKDANDVIDELVDSMTLIGSVTGGAY